MASFDEAVSVLLMTQPFFGTLLLKMEHVRDDTFPTLCVTRKKLIYSQKFLDQLNLDETVFCVAHEVMHQAWMHLPRMEHYIRSGVGPDGQALDVMLFNMALDYPINDMLRAERIGSVPQMNLCLDARWPQTMVPEEIYCELRKEQEKKGGGKGAGNGQQTLDQHDALADAGEEGAIQPADVLQAAAQHKAIRGSLPASLERLLGEIKKPDVSPWRRLRQFITTSLPGHDASTWRRLQRRMIVRGVGMPGRVAQGAGRIGIVADTSGSIGDEMLALFAGHMAAIMADAKPRDVVLYWTDAAVHSNEVIKTPTQLRAYLQKGAKGGGGTDMPKGVRAAEADACDCIVVLTDGYTPFCDSTKPLVWAITDAGITASGNGTTIHIAE